MCPLILLGIIPRIEFLFQNDDAGEYKCVATNDAGSSEGTAQLIVRSKCYYNVVSQAL